MRDRRVGAWHEVADLAIGLSIVMIADLGGTAHLALCAALLAVAV